MNKRQIIASLNKIANELDKNGLYKEATSVTNVMKKVAILTDSNLQSAELAKELERELDQILWRHSGFSAAVAIGSLKTYYSESPESREGIFKKYKLLAQNADKLYPEDSKRDPYNMERSNAFMNRDVYKLIVAARNFKKKHNIRDEIMKQIISMIN